MNMRHQTTPHPPVLTDTTHTHTHTVPESHQLLCTWKPSRVPFGWVCFSVALVFLTLNSNLASDQRRLQLHGMSIFRASKGGFQKQLLLGLFFFCVLSKPIIRTATAHINSDPQTALLDLIYSCYFCPRPPTLFNSIIIYISWCFGVLIHFSSTPVLFGEGVSPVRIFTSAALILLPPRHHVLLWVPPALFYDIFFPPRELTVPMLCRSAALLRLRCAFCKEKPGCLKVFTSSWTCLCGSDGWREAWVRACVENYCNYCVPGLKETLLGPVGIIANDRAWVTWLESLNLIGWLLSRNIRGTSTVKSYLRH